MWAFSLNRCSFHNYGDKCCDFNVSKGDLKNTQKAFYQRCKQCFLFRQDNSNLGTYPVFIVSEYFIFLTIFTNLSIKFQEIV